jgi:thiosulfate reductase/polysulfide reductase chain A
MKRRDFIRISAAGAAGAAVLGGLGSNWYGHYADPVEDPATEGERVVPTFCELCFWRCGVLAHVKDGRVTKLKGNPRHPLSRGRLCPRGAGGTGLLYDPDRLKTPLRRVSKRGGQEFSAISWDEALDETAHHFNRIIAEHGAGALGLFYHGWGANWMKQLFTAAGCPNIAAPSYAQCRGPRDVGFTLTYGHGVGSPEVTDLEHTRCLVLIGSHLGENRHNTPVQDFAAAIRGGADLIVVDPRFSVAASKARHWLPIRPGSDLALLLAWMHVIIGENRHDATYVERHTTGFEQLKAHVAPFSPEWAYPRTGIEPALIRETARLMAGAAPATLVHPGRHVTWYGDDTQRSRAIAILGALLGSWGRRGGFFIPSRLELPGYPGARKPPSNGEALDKPAPSHYPLADEVLAQGLCDATVPGLQGRNLRAWMVYGSNLPTTLPAPARVHEAIQRLDFLVTVDVLPAEICGWSDIVLPEATYLERCDDLHAPPWRQPFVAVRQEVVPPLHDSKPGWWIARGLAARMGLAEHFPWADSMDYAKARVAAAGLSCEQLQEEGVALGPPQPLYFEEGAPADFPTDSGRIELYSATLAALGFDPMPVYTDHGDPPAGWFRLLFGRAPTHSFGRTTNNRLLSTTYRENEVWVNRRAAARWSLKEGDRVRLQNQDGVLSTFDAPVKLTERIRPDAVYIVHGYGRRAKGLRFVFGRGIDSAELISRSRTDPIMGGTGMNVNFVTLVPSEGVAAAAGGGDA